MTTRTRSSRRTKPTDGRRETMLADFTVVPLSAEERHRAALAVCHRASTVEEARELLDALGLLHGEKVAGAA